MLAVRVTSVMLFELFENIDLRHIVSVTRVIFTDTANKHGHTAR